jgi:hypothetical protein
MFAKSYQLDPLPGALFTEAECEAVWGKVATAMEHYQAFLKSLTALSPDRRAKFDERRDLALQKVAALGPLASDLTIDVAPSSPKGLTVKRNGVVVDREAYGVSKKVDPGEYTIVAEIEGRNAWERRVTLGRGERARIEVPWLESSNTTPAGPTTEPASTVATTSAPSPRAESTGGSTARTLAYFAGGIGVGGLAAGIITGALAVKDKRVIEDNCPERRCNATGLDALETGRAAATVSNIGFSVGIAGAAAATILWIVSTPGQEAAEPRAVRPIFVATEHGAGLGVGGAFR